MRIENKLLREVIERLTRKYSIKAIILMGSRARGDWTPWSDYDLLIIGDFSEKYLDRIKSILEVIGETPLEVEPHPYTLEEAMEMLRRGNPLVVDAMEEGIVLYATNEIEKLKSLYEELKRRGLRRSRTSIIVPACNDGFQ